MNKHPFSSAAKTKDKELKMLRNVWVKGGIYLHKEREFFCPMG
jgi:hypothetical protein